LQLLDRMDQLPFWLYPLLVVGSLCGLSAAVRLGGLAHRLTVLEHRLAVATPLSVVAGPGLAPVLHASAAMPAIAAIPNAATPAPMVQAPAVPPADPAKSDADWWHGFELRAGTRWVTWLGAGALVVAAALFVKLAVDRGWLGPAARLALECTVGVGLLLAGRRAHRAEMTPLAQGLFGAGLGVLYVATYVGFTSYGLIAREIVLAAMIGVTITGCAIAIRHDAQAIAVLALLGGLLTPVAVSSGDGSREALLAYLLVLDLGALAIAMLRRWHALELIALAGTWVMFGGWLSRAHAADARSVELAWLAVFHVTFVALPLGFHLFRKRAAGLGRSSITIANAAVTIAGAMAILDGRRDDVGAVVLAMTALYAVLEVAVRRRLADGARGDHGFVALAAALATLAVPLLLRDRAVTIAWSLEAPVLLALGFHDRRFSLRVAALGVLALAMLHGVAAHGLTWDADLRAFTIPPFTSAMLAPLAAWLFAGVHAALRDRGDARDRWHGTAAALTGAGLALALVHVAVAHGFALVGRNDLGDAAVPLVWAVGSLLALAAVGRREETPAPIRTAIALAAVVAAGLCVDAYGAPGHPDALLALNLRFAGALVTALAVAANASVLARRSPEHGQLAWAAVVTAFGLAIGAEAYLHYAVDPLAPAGRHAHTALSIAWSAYAAGLLAIGFVRRHRRFRLAGLGLLGFVAIKLLLIDLAGAPQAYRVLSFLVTGALMIAVSYAYHRLERRQTPPEK
jgi:uncharacterized membrane protein